MSIALIREGLGDNLRTLPGLRVAETIPDSFSPPIAIISLGSVQYNGAFNTRTVQGLTTYNFTVSVIVGKVAERVAQARLDSYISTGSASPYDDELLTETATTGTGDLLPMTGNSISLVGVGVMLLGIGLGLEVMRRRFAASLEASSR